MNDKTANIKPHDVTLTIKYRDGTHKTLTVDWNTIHTMRLFHNQTAIEHAYQVALEDSTN